MPIKVFVSHSTGAVPEDAVFLADLCARLRAINAADGSLQFEVFYDKDELRAGDHWRKKLLDTLGSCHAGIVVLNTRALETDQHPWVHTEASILRWRMWMGEKLALILMLRGAGSGNAYSGRKEWEPLAFDALQFLGGKNEFTGATLEQPAFDELVGQLKATDVAPAETRYELLRQALRNKLKGFPLDPVDANRWADRLLTEGPAALPVLIQAEVDPDQRAVDGALGLIAPWWINPRSSCLLAGAALNERPSAFALNGSDIRYTPRMYVRHACCLGENYAWKVVPIGANAGNQKTAAFVASVITEVRKGLKDAFPKLWPPGTKVSDKQINDLVRNLLDGNPPQPTFVALPNHIAANKAIADAVLGVFPDVRLILMTTSPQRAAAIPHAAPLLPLPDAAVEAQELANYNNMRARLN